MSYEDAPRPELGPDADESTTLGKLAAALAKAQGAMEAAKLDAKNSGYGKRYATLSSVWEACRGPLSANGLAVVQRVGGDERRIIITTDLIHGESGEFMRSRVVVPAEADGRRNMAQAVGTSISYLRRYSLAAMVGIAQEDDDAESAGKAAPKRERADGPTATAADAPPAAPTTFPDKFGPAKGALIHGAEMKHLEAYLNAALKAVGDPAKERWKAGNQALADAIGHEISRQQTGAANSPKSPESSPPAVARDTVSVAKELIAQAESGRRVDEILNRAGPKVSTEDFAELTAAGKLRKALLAGGAAHGPPGDKSLFDPEPGAGG